MTESYDGREVIGMDLYRRRSVLVRMTGDGQKLETPRITNSPAELRPGREASEGSAGGDVRVVLGGGHACRGGRARPVSGRSCVLGPRPARTGTPTPGPAARPGRTCPRSAHAPHPAPPQQCPPPCRP
jgi:hypothetical protein